MRCLAFAVPVLLLAGCFDPDSPSSETEGSSGMATTSTLSTQEGSGTMPSSTTGSTTDPTVGTTDPTSSSATTAVDSSSSGESSSSSSSSSTTGEPAECANGEVEEGEYCLVVAPLVTIGCPPEHLAAGDVDGNGTLDLVYTSPSDGEMQVYLGDGDGGFAPGSAEVVAPQDLALGHFNDDRDIDIAFSIDRGPPSEVGIILNDGNGTIPGAPPTYATVSFAAVATGDLDGNGFDDVIVTGSGGQISVALSANNGSGTFAVSDISAGGNGLRAGVVITELNNNANLDFAHTVSGSGGSVRACLGNGSGGTSSCNSGAVGTTPVGIAAGDINADGNMDLVTANSGSDDITILRGQGNGGFEDGITVAAGARPWGVAVEDLNLDGYDDVVVTNRDDGSLSVYLVDSAGGGFMPPVVYVVDATLEVTEVVTGDFNGDGAPDIAVGNATTGRVALLLSDP